ncbi:hypothetical protein EVAR_12050_1 [Eumeta japonica]|uniref:Uncharacterized protein n=1 Tax=Eumeta variegata TaxID=151549 RepID=A0A4C1U571_EUMVA|nr:hypothetical protein EVAR_12050_1 [Eumeta japonica]
MEKARGKRRRGWRWVRACGAPPWGFADPEDERLYEAYTGRQRQRAVPRLLAAGALLQVFAALVPGEARFSAAFGLCACALLADGALAAAHRWASRARPLLAHAAWAVLWAQVACGAARRRGRRLRRTAGVGGADAVPHAGGDALPPPSAVALQRALYCRLPSSAVLQRFNLGESITRRFLLPDSMFSISTNDNTQAQRTTHISFSRVISHVIFYLIPSQASEARHRLRLEGLESNLLRMQMDSNYVPQQWAGGAGGGSSAGRGAITAGLFHTCAINFLIFDELIMKCVPFESGPGSNLNLSWRERHDQGDGEPASNETAEVGSVKAKRRCSDDVSAKLAGQGPTLSGGAKRIIAAAEGGLACPAAVGPRHSPPSINLLVDY